MDFPCSRPRRWWVKIFAGMPIDHAKMHSAHLKFMKFHTAYIGRGIDQLIDDARMEAHTQ